MGISRGARSWLSSLLALAALGAASPGYAQAVAALEPDEPDGSTSESEETARIGEIIVTARRREESLQETPISISAFSSESLDTISATNLNDLGDVTPNLLASAGQVGSSDANFFIRGIGQFDYFSSVDPGVGLYIDGVYFARMNGGNLDVGDVERIEVLRGPQGTLFGRNAIGGAINVVLKRPEPGFSGRVKATVGSRDRYDVETSFNVPVIGDVLLSRFSFVSRNQDGYVRRFYDDERHGDVADLSFRGQLLFKPSDSFSANLSVDALRGRGTGPGVINRGLNVTPSPFGVPMPADINLDKSSDRFLSFSGLAPLQDLDVWGAALTLDWSLSDTLAIKSITAARGIDLLFTLDNDGTGYAFYDLLAPTDQSQFSQELQFSGTFFDERLKSLVGLFYFTEKVDQTNGVCLGSVPVRLSPTCLRFFQNIKPKIRSYAGFTQHTFEITDRLSATAGLRVSRERKKITYDFRIDNTAGLSPFLPPIQLQALPLTTVAASFTSVTPRFDLNYKVTPDVLVYASYSEGFRSGGFNGRPTSVATLQPYDPEESYVYEVGLKGDFFDRRLRTNFAVWYNDYKRIQLTNFSDGFITVDNAGDAELYGFEAEITAVPTEGLQLFVGIGYIHSQYTRLAPGAGGGLITKDDPLPYTPKWNVTTSVDYGFELANASKITAHVDYAYVSDINFQPAAMPGDRMDGYSLVGARLAYDAPGRDWRVAGFVRNLFKEKYDLIRFDLTDPGNVGVSTFYPAPPREFGLELTYRW